MKKIICIIPAALLLWSCQKKSTSYAPAYTFNLEKFEQNIKDTYTKGVTGFSYTIASGGTIQKFGAAGLERRSDDKEKSYTIQTRQHLFSVTKFVTAVAICKALQAMNKTLDEKVVNYLPASWTIHSSYDKLTFRQLLSHKSGFKTESDYYNDLKLLMSQPQGDTAYNYNNSNFTLCRILLPYMRYNDAWIEQQNASLETGTAILFRIQIRELVLKPSGILHWDKVDFKDWIHNNDPDYKAPRYYINDEEGTASIGFGDYLLRAGAGALVLSSYEMTQILAAFENNKLLPENWVNAMKQFACGFSPDVINGAHGNYYWKNGGYSDAGGRGGETIIMLFPNNVQVSINSNSHPSKGKSLVAVASQLSKAYDNAW